jgi:ribosomal protein S12 methylthiotransferase accessory factor
MTVQLRLTLTPMDASLRQLADFVDQRSAESPAPAVDLGALGLRGPAGGVAERDDGPVCPVRLYRGTALVGPTYRPGDAGPCPRCLERRWLFIRPESEQDAIAAGAEPGLPAAPAELTAFALDGIWRLVQHAAGTADPYVYELRLDTLGVTRHPLLADPDCPDCGSPVPDTRERAVPALRSRRKSTVDNYRLRSVSEHELPMDAYANPVCGVLGTAANRSYRSGVTAPVAGVFRCRGRFGFQEVTWGGHATSFASSEVYAALEGLERYAGLRPRGRSGTVFDSYQNLREDALDPLSCGVYPPEFYRKNAAFRPYAPDRPLHWTWGYSLRDGRPLLVPEQLSYYLDRRPDHPNFVQECSSGCASGSSLEEAVLHGLLELIERDAFVLTWYAGRAPQELDLATCPDPQIQFIRGRLALEGYEARLFDLRVDLPVPALLAVSVRPDHGPGTLSLAAAASMNPLDAARTALGETASYVTDLPRRVEAWEPRLRAMAADYDNVVDLGGHSTLYGLPEMLPHAEFLFGGPPARSFDEAYAPWLAARPATLDLLDDVRYCVDLVTALGSDVIVVDQTCPEQAAIGARTACVIAPGLAPIDFGWHRQRVLNHPRLLGLLQGAAPHLHPHPFP